MSTAAHTIAHSTAAAGTHQPNTVLVAGQQGESVAVQSQLATSHIPGNVASHSNIGQVMSDLGAHKSSTGAWLDAENAKVSAWGQNEIQRVLQQTKATEEALVLGAKEKQKAMDARHSGELAKLVQELDLRKAAQLKELEDGLQRTIQATLSSSKADINRVESEMNNKKMDLLKQSQLQSAKEIDALSNLVVETKLTPSQTRTVIETNTHTGNVVAVATGGHISTGSATAATHSSQQIAVAPAGGQIRQAADVTTGDMIQDSTGRKVGEGAIVNTQTRVVADQQQQHSTVAHPHSGAAVALPAAHHSAGVVHAAAPVAAATHGVAHAVHPTATHTATHPATHAVHPASSTSHAAGTIHPTTVVAGAPIASGGHTDAAISHKSDLRSTVADHQLHAVHAKDSAVAHGHHAGSSHDGVVLPDGAEPHQHGLLCKVKHALGMETKGDKIAKEQIAKEHTVVGTEPRATTHARVL